MAAPMAVCRLQALKEGGSLLKVLHNVDTSLHRTLGTNAVAVKERERCRSLYEVQAERQEQAERSVLISCHNRTNDTKFLKYLSRHGEINKYFFYESYGTYAVVEFANRDSLTSLFEEASIPSASHESTVPFKSRLLSMKTLGLVDSANQRSDLNCQPQTAIPINDLIQRLSREQSIDQQITSLTDVLQLTEENSRLRFLVCSLLKDIAAAYFPECTIKPFGSSVNGFGKLGCDLDMFLDLDGISGRNTKMLLWTRSFAAI